jgi:hypothetical protein
MGALSRRKGAHFERVLVTLFREAMPGATIRRGLQARSGEEVADVDLPCFHVEAKHHHKTNVRAALKQALDEAQPGKWPVAVCKDDHAHPIVAMQLEDFLDLVREWWERRR